MLQRILPFLVIIGAAYWYWSGPYQEKSNPSYEATVKQNDKAMAQCIRAAAYKRGSTGTGLGSSAAREQCAKQYNLYELEGHWHSYDSTRPE